MPKFQVERKHSNIGLFAVIVIVQVGLLGLFAYQTWDFVNILFPNDYLLMRVLSVVSVDGMALAWSALKWFYRFAHPHAKTAATWGKWIDYGLSALISVVYMVMTYTFRFYHVTDLTTIQIGTVASIAALIFNVVMVFVFLDNEIKTRWPAEDEYELLDSPKPEKQGKSLASVASSPRLADVWNNASPAERRELLEPYLGKQRTSVQDDEDSERDTSPLSQPRMTTTSQEGNGNGNGRK